MLYTSLKDVINKLNTIYFVNNAIRKAVFYPTGCENYCTSFLLIADDRLQIQVEIINNSDFIAPKVQIDDLLIFWLGKSRVGTACSGKCKTAKAGDLSKKPPMTSVISFYGLKTEWVVHGLYR